MEKVIKGLETCIPMKYETSEEKECRHEQCPYGRENYKPMNGCFWDLMSDALALLKKQETQKFFVDESGKITPLPVVVRCKDCKHRPVKPNDYENGFDLAFPDNKCPCQCEDGWYSWYPGDDWFCADGEQE